MRRHGTHWPAETIPTKLSLRRDNRRPWMFDASCVLALLPEAATKWIDNSGKGNNGTISNGTWKVGSRRRDMLSFNGTSTIVNCGADASLKPGNYQSVVLWFKLNSIATSTVLFNTDLLGTTKDLAIGFSTVSDQLFLGSASTSVGLADVSAWITTGVWYHWVQTYNRSTDAIRFFLNGEEQTLIVAASFFTPAGNIVSVGARTTGSYTNGVIDECLVFNKLLSPSEAKALYEMGKP